ncbi:MAG: FKBP-type peptidyl-prolyl cis-trans isomerase [Bacteroidia bacterium]|nr:FKBP-type peptidyl-prolyl cis-trans isomerase [Bacteroidia bacterium]
MPRILTALLPAAMLIAACGPSGSQQQTAASQPASQPAAAPAAPKPFVMPPYEITDATPVRDVEGIRIYTVHEGQGAVPKPGSNVVIHYHGMLTDGTVFDSSFDRGQVADFGLGNLIRGWQIGLTQVRTGSRVRLVIPPELGYGERGSGKIPANSTLVFDIELIGTY